MQKGEPLGWNMGLVKVLGTYGGRLGKKPGPDMEVAEGVVTRRIRLTLPLEGEQLDLMLTRIWLRGKAVQIGKGRDPIALFRDVRMPLIQFDRPSRDKENLW